MLDSSRLQRDFFNRPTPAVARDLLGKRLVRLEDSQRLSGIIIETEAYRGEEDQGCHAKAGMTPRTRVMYGPPGHAYIYFTYGMHWMLNVVTEGEGFPAAVLIRAIRLLEGQEVVASRRKGQPPQSWTDGPAKLCQALNIDGRLNGVDICAPNAPLFIEMGVSVPDWSVTITPRVGLNSVAEPWKSKPWRYLVEDYRFLE